MNVALWVGQVVLAAVFTGAGITHATRRDRPAPHAGAAFVFYGRFVLEPITP